jgi:hypothetical protein
VELPRGGYQLVTSNDGVLFPSKFTAYGRYGDGPALSLTFEVTGGQPVLRRVAIGDESDAQLSASAVHALPLDQLINQAITTAALQTQLVKRAFESTIGEPTFRSEDEQNAERIVRAVSVRGRPIDDETLRRVAQLAKANPFSYREDIKEQLNVSLRTASRWVAAAKNRGFLDKEASS